MEVLEKTVVDLRGVTRGYPNGVRALDAVSVGFRRGSFTAVMGPSGSGKSTLLHCAAGLDRADSGQIVLTGQTIGQLREPKLTEERRRLVGFVFQTYNLIEALSVWHNVLLPQQLAGVRPDRSWARDVLSQLGLSGVQRRRPGQLSGGQRNALRWRGRSPADRRSSSRTSRPERWICRPAARCSACSGIPSTGSASRS